MWGRPQVVVSYGHHPTGQLLAGLDAGTSVSIRDGDSLTIEIDPTDLLFIDTVHTAERLGAELARHAANVSLYLVLHDTETFGKRGEDGGPGLLAAVELFLAAHPEWEISYQARHNNGLTVLRRIADEPQRTVDTSGEEAEHVVECRLDGKAVIGTVLDSNKQPVIGPDGKLLEEASVFTPDEESDAP